MLSFFTSLAAGTVKDWLKSRKKIAEAKAVFGIDKFLKWKVK